MPARRPLLRWLLGGGAEQLKPPRPGAAAGLQPWWPSMRGMAVTPFFRPRLRPARALAALFSTALAACMGGGPRSGAAAAPPDSLESFGALTLVTHEGGASGRSGASLRWSLRWQGQPLALDTRGGLFGDQPQQARTVNAVFVRGQGEAAELIVNVGDPNNTSAFHLLRQQGGVLQAPLLCVSLGGDNTVRWLDAPAEAGARAPSWGGPQHQRLDGPGAGRLLALGSRCVHDLATGQTLPVPAPPAGVSLLNHLGAVAVAPSRRQLAHVAVQERGGEDGLRDVLAVVDLATARWQVLAIDRGRMRYPTREAIDSAWVAHHFEWRRAAGSAQALAPRAHFVPLPRRGHYRQSGAAEYHLEDTLAGAKQVLQAFLVQRFGATPLPPSPYDEGRILRLSWRDHELMVHDAGFYLTVPVAVLKRGYFSGQPGDPALARQLVRELGDAVDAELAAGRLAAMFAAAPGR